MTAKPEDCPDWGKDWNSNHVMCAGGMDPTYRNPADGTNMRQRCRWFAQCAQRTALYKLGQRKAPIPLPATPATPAHPHQWNPAQALATGIVQGAQMGRPAQTVQVKPNPAQLAPQPQQGYPQAMAPPAAAGMPYMVPMNYAAYGAQMPAYLTIPEPVIPHQHWGSRLAYTLMRSMMKAAGHSTANFFDHTTVNPYPVPLPTDETGQT